MGVYDDIIADLRREIRESEAEELEELGVDPATVPPSGDELISRGGRPHDEG